MRILFAIFLICTAAKKEAHSISNLDFKVVATDLLNKVSTIKNIINKVQSQIEVLQSFLKQKANMSDFGIPQNPQIIEITDTFKKYEFKRGIESCKKIYNDQIQSLNQELENIFIKEITSQLDNNKLTLNAILQTLENISDNLEGSNLDAEIILCTNNPEKCRLTNEYPGEVDHSEKSTNFIATMTPTLIDVILKTAVYPKLPDKINVEVYKPVMNCINGL